MELNKDTYLEMTKGYKQTELGIIPVDWEIVELVKLTTKIGDGIHSTPQYTDNGDYYFVNGNNLGNGKIIISEETKKVSNEEYLLHKRDLSDDTVLLSINGTIGNIAFYLGEKIVLGKSAAYININDKLDKKFFFQILQSAQIRKYFENELTGSTIKNLGLAVIRNTPIPLPPKKNEQVAIATALSDMDELISQTEKLIEKKKAIKQGVMQELLKPKEGWVAKKLGNLISRISTGLNPRTNFKLNSGGQNFYVTIKNFKAGKLFLDDKCDNIDDEALKIINNRSDLRIDDILLASIGRVGDLYLIKEQPQNWNINESVFTLRPDQSKIKPAFLCFLFEQSSIKSILQSGATGSTFQSIKVGDLKKLEFCIPTDLSEQNRISNILTDFDNYLEKLEMKLHKLNFQKQGMMQALLTGKIRLI
jgi:type I restriction enzyme S subunit